MKKNIAIAFLLVSFVGHAQVNWNQTGDNTTAGRVVVSGTTSSTDYDDVVIQRNKPNAGIKIFNASTTGRSIILFGQALGGKYGFVGHVNQSHVAGTGYMLSYRPSSTVLCGADANGLGIISTQDIRFNAGGDTDANQRMVISANGKVGIGSFTPAPTESLHLRNSFNGELSFLIENTYSIGTRTFLTATPTRSMLQTDRDFGIWTNGGGWSEKFTVLNGGNVGIGTTIPDAKLAVKGTIHAQEVKVDLSVPGPDYVFEENYNLPSLTDTETYIKQNKHLPEVPSACEMEENGVNLSEMNMLLLKKMEELTLHLINQEKTNAELNQRLLKLENKN